MARISPTLCCVTRGDEQRRHAPRLAESFFAGELDAKKIQRQNHSMKPCLLLAVAFCFALNNLRATDANEAATSSILTPPAPATPRINGPNVFGVRPGSPFLYTIPATGERPMTFSIERTQPD
jgi:hypothetical protein